MKNDENKTAIFWKRKIHVFWHATFLRKDSRLLHEKNKNK